MSRPKQMEDSLNDGKRTEITNPHLKSSINSDMFFTYTN